MNKVVKAVYDATHNTLRLVEPLDGVRDHEKVQVRVIADREDAGKARVAFDGAQRHSLGGGGRGIVASYQRAVPSVGQMIERLALGRRSL